MIKVESIKVDGFEPAIRAMRNPMNSWNKSDSHYIATGKRYEDIEYIVGENDLLLMKKLYTAGPEHRTYARMIGVWLDITAPLYWWKEMDRYTVGKSQVSTSTMHKIQAKEFSLEDFSIEHLNNESITALKNVIYELNRNRVNFNATHEKKYWWQMIQLLPSSYNQRRTAFMSYETAFKIIRERTGHKLDEWHTFVEILQNLPYVKAIIEGNEQ